MPVPGIIGHGGDLRAAMNARSDTTGSGLAAVGKLRLFLQ